MLLHHGRLGAAKGTQASNPIPALGNWAVTCQYLRDLMLSAGGAFEGFLFSALSLQVH